MEITMVLNIIRVVAYFVLGGLAVYFKYNTKLNQKVTTYINEAEEQFQSVTKSGGLKFQWVVDRLYALIPTPLNLIFTKEMIGVLVQTAFDGMASYATKQLDKVVDKVID